VLFRTNRYWSITHAMPRSLSRTAAGFVLGTRRLASALTTRPAQRIFTSHSVPNTWRGNTISNVILEPTFKGRSALTCKPAALTSVVVALCLRGEWFSVMVMGNCKGNRCPVRASCTVPPAPRDPTALAAVIMRSSVLVYTTKTQTGTVEAWLPAPSSATGVALPEPYSHKGTVAGNL